MHNKYKKPKATTGLFVASDWAKQGQSVNPAIALYVTIIHVIIILNHLNIKHIWKSVFPAVVYGLICNINKHLFFSLTVFELWYWMNAIRIVFHIIP